jgi:hypothetical protein
MIVLRARVEEGIDEIRALRAWLKVGLREFGLVCVEVCEEDNQQRRTTMDMRKYNTGFIGPDDVRDGPRVDKIIHIYEDKKFGRPVLELESGSTFSVNVTNNKILSKAWGYKSEDWLDQQLKFSLGSYRDRKTDEDKGTVVVEPISPAKPGAQNGGAAKSALPASSAAAAQRRDDMDDSIPFLLAFGIFLAGLAGNASSLIT